MVARAASAPAVQSLRATALLPWLVAVALFMEALDITILNTGVPVIARALGVAPLSMRSVLASYTLGLAVFIPVSGWMADRFGTRKVFAAAIGIFTLGSLLCGLVSDIKLMVACRILQGSGGAMMMPVGWLTLARTFSKQDLVRAVSFVGIPGLVGPLLGPFVGGLIVTYLHWRMIFFLNIPIGIAGLILVYLHLPDYRGSALAPFDAVGLLLFGSGIALLSYVLEIFGVHTLTAGKVLGLLTVSLTLICGYGLHGSRTPFPLLDLSLFRVRTFATATGGGFLTRLGIGGVPFLLPLLYQVGLGFTPAQSGLLFMPQVAATMGTKVLIPKLLNHFGYRSVLITNTIAVGVVVMLFATIGPDTSVWMIVTLALCLGVVTSIQHTSMNTLVYADIPDTRTSSANSIANTLQQLSFSFGVAASGLITLFLLPSGPRSALLVIVQGLHRAFVGLGLVTIAAALIFNRLQRKDGATASPK
jgi:EmrB/QacA subfamily drug resistance transporter